MKKQIKITENELHQIIENSVKRVLKEGIDEVNYRDMAFNSPEWNKRRQDVMASQSWKIASNMFQSVWNTMHELQRAMEEEGILQGGLEQGTPKWDFYMAKDHIQEAFNMIDDLMKNHDY